MPDKVMLPHINDMVFRYQTAQKNLIDIIAKQEYKGNVTAYRKSVLANVNAELDSLNKYVDSWTNVYLPLSYENGADSAYAYFRRNNVPVGVVALNQAVIEDIVFQAREQYVAANAYIGRRIADEFREVGMDVIANKVATGSMVKEAQKEMVKRFADKGVSTITYRNGKVVQMDVYARLVAITTTSEATNKGSMNAVQALGYDLVRMSQNLTTCPICAVFEGRIYSISGDHPDYPALSEAFYRGYNTIHPNCFIDRQVPILTSKGYVEIGDIKVGDLVLSHKGKFRKVTQLHRNLGRPTIVKLFIRGYHNENWNQLTLTSEHPVLINGEWVKAKDIKPGDKVKLLSKPCEHCGQPTFTDKKSCSRECDIALTIKNRDTSEWHNNLSAACKKASRKKYDEGRVDRYAITAQANIKTREMVAAGTHPFSDIANIIKGQKALGSKHYGKTWIEEKVGWLLKEKLGVETESQFPIPKSLDSMGRQRYYFADFKTKGHDIVIECDGENWHQDIEADAERQKYIESLGYTVIRFTGKQIKDNLIACGEEVKRILANHNDEYVFMDVEVVKVEIKESKRTHTLYNLSVDKDESYIAKGYVVHNCNHRVFPYIPELDDDESENRVQSNRPFVVDDDKKAGIARYNEQQQANAQRARDRAEWIKAKTIAPEKTPATFSGYRAGKRANSKAYQDMQAEVKRKSTKPVKIINHKTRGHIAEHNGPREFDFENDKRIAQIMEDTGYDYATSEKIEKDIQDYFDRDYTDIRLKTSPYYAKVSDEIDEYIYKSPKYEGEISRGIRLTDAEISELKTGNIIDMQGVSSWTSEQRVSEKFANMDTEKNSVIVQVKSNTYGTSVSHLSKYGLEESEVLLPSNAKYKINNVEKIVPTKTVLKGETSVTTYSEEYQTFFGNMESKYGKKEMWSKMSDKEFDRAEYLESHGKTKEIKKVYEEAPTGERTYYVIEAEETS